MVTPGLWRFFFSHQNPGNKTEMMSQSNGLSLEHNKRIKWIKMWKNHYEILDFVCYCHFAAILLALSYSFNDHNEVDRKQWRRAKKKRRKKRDGDEQKHKPHWHTQIYAFFSFRKNRNGFRWEKNPLSIYLCAVFYCFFLREQWLLCTVIEVWCNNEWQKIVKKFLITPHICSHKLCYRFRCRFAYIFFAHFFSPLQYNLLSIQAFNLVSNYLFFLRCIYCCCFCRDVVNNFPRTMIHIYIAVSKNVV